ncbi:N-acetylmannosamine-6-phosphate 2-epimerase [Candidatus Sumerlaeota bacterium]|nr:N-acetylmannosamine-6-phosphate 2-epimerase [Candidatus Sumerlaeota bacterium]
MKKFTDIFSRGLIVSCQAREGEPLFSSDIMARMADSARIGGAIGIRANAPSDIKAIKKRVPLPLIGIYKIISKESEVYITPTFESARVIAEAGADVIALDATGRPRPNGETLRELIERIHKELDIPVMGDCSTLEEGIAAVRFGADAIATTLSGNTPYSPQKKEPDWKLLSELIEKVDAPVVAEGRFNAPELAAKAIQMGAYAVVVGTAITRPHEVTSWFSQALLIYK